eukprot:2804770-Prymnesium_polylepis.2
MQGALRDAHGGTVRPAYDHVAFYCKHVELQPLRQRWAEDLLQLRQYIEAPGTPDKELLNALRLLRPARFPTSRGVRGVPHGDMCLACDDDEQNEIERGLRRIAGGRFNTPTGLSKAGSGAAMREAAREAAAPGALLQIVARKLNAETTEGIQQAAKEQAIARKYGRRWRQRVLAGGPERIAALAHIDDVRHRLLKTITLRLPAARWRAASLRLCTAVAKEVAVAKARHRRHRRDVASAWWVGWRSLR